MDVRREGYEMRKRRAQRRKPQAQKQKAAHIAQPKVVPTEPKPTFAKSVSEAENDELKAFLKHPLTKAALIVGGLWVTLYMSSYMLNAAAKAANSFHNFKQAALRNRVGK